jgi:predicted kinase
MITDKDWKHIEAARAVVMCGLPGSGKSYWAKKISKKINAVILESDRYRQKTFNETKYGRKDRSDEMAVARSIKAYEMMYQEAATLLSQGKKVVLDATHLNHDQEQWFEKLREVKASYVVVVVRASDDEVGERLKSNPARLEKVMRARKRIRAQIERGEVGWPDGSRSSVIALIEGN